MHLLLLLKEFLPKKKNKFLSNRRSENLGRTCVLCGLLHHLQYCLMSTELYNEIHKDMRKKKKKKNLLLRHSLSPHSLKSLKFYPDDGTPLSESSVFSTFCHLI